MKCAMKVAINKHESFKKSSKELAQKVRQKSGKELEKEVCKKGDKELGRKVCKESMK